MRGRGCWAWLAAGLLVACGGRSAFTTQDVDSTERRKTSCVDDRKSGDETDVDCGGPDCEPCGLLKECLQDRDCWTSVCRARMCSAQTCDDGLVNGDETDLDCGGKTCAPCPDGAVCERGDDCQNRLCLDEYCQPASCVDGVQNGAETDVDCFGDCLPCESCNDGLLNGTESDVDCGGACGRCPLDRICRFAEDCASEVCLSRDTVPISHCSRAECRNEQRDGNETDVDCGGPDCGFCYLGQTCQSLPDCGGAHCDGFCQQPCETVQECDGIGTCEGGRCVYCHDASDCAPGQCGADVDCLCRNGYCSRY